MFETQIPEVSLLAAFLAGVVSFLSPCVLPLVPSYVTFITGVSFDELTAEDKTGRVRRLTILHSIAFIVGFSIVFISLGATATAAGRFLREYQDLLRQVGGVLIILFGLYLTGLLPIAALSREAKFRMTSKPLGLLGSVLVGITFAAGWTPCIGPILASILLYASTAEKAGTGVLLLSIYSLGLGVPFFLASLGMNTFLAASRKLRASLRIIEIVSGVILIAFGVALVTNLFRHFVAFLSRFLPALG
ncbi:MAG TPA: cytochrome c biogenesis protein CcdA [Acidobacteriota bacterium]|jgi:cytochrome c-type biogenesis protein|nr:cytochrome c biogenesis protein CcdA [Acidobacteriota bacterium]